MKDPNTENQVHLVNAELGRRVALIAGNLLEKTSVVEALQDSEKRYRRLFESAKDGILILDAGPVLQKKDEHNHFLPCRASQVSKKGNRLCCPSGAHRQLCGQCRDIQKGKHRVNLLTIRSLRPR